MTTQAIIIQFDIAFEKENCMSPQSFKQKVLMDAIDQHYKLSEIMLNQTVYGLAPKL